MTEYDLKEKIAEIMTILGDDNCPPLSDSVIKVDDIDKVNKATLEAYNKLDELSGKITMEGISE